MRRRTNELLPCLVQLRPTCTVAYKMRTASIAAKKRRNDSNVSLRTYLLSEGERLAIVHKPYLEADQRLVNLYGDQNAWTTKAIVNVANSGKFSSDRTIADYAKEIWNVKACPVE